MRSLIAIVTVTLVLITSAGLSWGWSGVWTLTALIPGLFLGYSLAHVAQARVTGERLRLGFVLMGLFLGTISAVGSTSLLRAATLSPKVQIVEDRTIEASSEWVWDAVAEPLMWTRWDQSIGSLDVTAAKGRPGDRYPSTLLLHGQPITATHVLEKHRKPHEVAWSIEPAAGARITGLRVELVIEAVGTTSRVSYRVEYELPEVLLRGLIGPALEDDFRNAATGSLEALALLVEDSMRL